MTPARTARRTARAAALLAVLSAAITAGATSASAAPSFLRQTPQTAAAVTAAVTPVDVLAVVGTNTQLYVKTTDQVGYDNLGGALIDAPGLAVGDQPYFVGIGTNNNVYVRTYDQGWAPLGPKGTNCSGASVAIVGNAMAVACRGSNGRLYVGKAVADATTSGRLPRITSFQNRGGQLLFGATVGVNKDAFYYDVIGTNRLVYEATDTSGLRPVAGSPTCNSSLAIDAVTGGGVACRAEDGALLVLSNATGQFVKIPGAIVGRPAVSVDDNGTSRYYALGTNRKIYTASQSPTGVITGFRNAPAGSGLFGLVSGSLTGTPLN